MINLLIKMPRVLVKPD